MPKIAGVREERHQPRYDTLTRTDGVTTLSSSTTLFGNANVGQIRLTNMKAAGVLPSDNSYSILAMRIYYSFENTATGPIIDRGMFYELSIAEKSQLQGHGWYLPAGGGIFSGGLTTIATNGVPSQESILRVARPITLPPRQNFEVEISFYDVGTESALTSLNADTSSKVIVFLVDGVELRDVL